MKFNRRNEAVNWDRFEIEGGLGGSFDYICDVVWTVCNIDRSVLVACDFNRPTRSHSVRRPATDVKLCQLCPDDHRDLWNGVSDIHVRRGWICRSFAGHVSGVPDGRRRNPDRRREKPRQTSGICLAAGIGSQIGPFAS